MPHALIGYAGSTLRAAEMFHAVFPDDPLYVLVDFFGREVTDALEVCRRFPELAAAGRLGVRLDTHGGRFIEGLDVAASYAVLERHVPQAIRTYRTAEELRLAHRHRASPRRPSTTCASSSTRAGFDQVKIIASSGFGPSKCKLMASVKAPVDIIGTGSYLPERWTETYATADVIAYDGALPGQGRPRVPVPSSRFRRRHGRDVDATKNPVEGARRRRQGPPDHLDDADPADHPRLAERAGDEGTAAEDRQRERGQGGHAQPRRDKRAGRCQMRHLEAWPDRLTGLRKGGIGQGAHARSRDHRDERPTAELLPATVLHLVQRPAPMTHGHELVLDQRAE